jgi:hypothetical protein
MATEVSICSNALQLLGDQPISSFNDNADRALLASNLWPSTRNALIRMHPWNCCVKRAVISPDAVAPSYGWAYSYGLPSDWVRTLACGQDGAEHSYKSEGRKILCDESTLYLRYIFRNTDPATWDELLVDAATLAMAAKMAYPITKSTAAKDAAAADLARFLKTARAVDGQDDPPDTLGDFPLLAARV